MPDLKSGFATMEATKVRLLAGLHALDADVLNRKPDQDTWSILQVIAHVTMEEGPRMISQLTCDPDSVSVFTSGSCPRINLATPS